jgi:hypothetical protein
VAGGGIDYCVLFYLNVSESDVANGPAGNVDEYLAVGLWLKRRGA